MQYKPRPTNFSLNHLRAGGLLVFLCFCPNVFCEESSGRERPGGAVICRTKLTQNRREALAGKLKKISGWPDLKFDAKGVLRGGNRESIGGSKGARELLAKVMLGTNDVVLEDVSRNSDVVFMRVVPGRWKTFDGPAAFVVQIDFADFDQVMGDEPALAAFDLGWALLHELDHIANDSEDAFSFGETGECEGRINQMRAECNLPQRVDYFYTLSPLTRNTTFSTRLMRLGFEQSQPGSLKNKRFWVVWDASRVGGLDPQKELAVLR